jgi:hypothetical protein
LQEGQLRKVGHIDLCRPITWLPAQPLQAGWQQANHCLAAAALPLLSVPPLWALIKPLPIELLQLRGLLQGRQLLLQHSPNARMRVVGDIAAVHADLQGPQVRQAGQERTDVLRVRLLDQQAQRV